MRPLFLVALVAVAFCVAAAPADAQRTKLRFRATLTPRNALPTALTRAQTQAQGSFTLTFTRTEPRNATWSLSLGRLTGQNVQAARVAVGAAGQTGPVLTTLFTGGSGSFGSKLVSVSLTENVLATAANGFATIFARANNGTELYVNIVSNEFPSGFLRGQLK